MIVLQKWFERLRPQFGPGGRFAALKPVFDATETFFFAPSIETQTAPHVRDPLDLKRFMVLVIVALLPCVASAVYFFGLRVLVMILVSYVVGGTVEVLFAVFRREEINEGFLVTGLIFPLVLPPALPLWMVGVGVAFGVLVGKELFGGTGRNLFNPALVGRCFLALAYPAAMAGDWLKPGAGRLGRLAEFATARTPGAATSATPLILAKHGELTAIHNLIIGNVAGSAGETSAAAVVLGGLFLVLTGVAAWQTVAGCLGTFLIVGGVLHAAAPGTFGPILWHLCAGGLLFGAFFMATDPVSSPATRAGRWAYGALIGLVTLLIRNLTGYVEGVMFAVLLGNICAPMIDEIVVRMHHRRTPR